MEKIANNLNYNENLAFDNKLINKVILHCENTDSSKLKQIIQPLHPADLADLLTFLDKNQRTYILKVLDQEQYTNVLAELDDTIIDETFEESEDAKIVQSISEMETDDAINLIETLEPDVQKNILDKVNLGGDVKPVLMSLSLLPPVIVSTVKAITSKLASFAL